MFPNMVSSQYSLKLDLPQEKVWQALIQISDYLSRSKGWFSYKKPHKGLYIWGPVGTGKTMLLNRFYNNLKTTRKIRLHFQHFMKNIHEKLNELANVQNPLKALGKGIAEKYDIVCIDELYIADIVDASIIGGVLEALYKSKIVLVITSNTSPENLYKNGLDRTRFLPAIDLLKKHNQIFYLNNNIDYRLQTKQNNNVFFFGNSENIAQKLRSYFLKISAKNLIKDGSITVNSSTIQYKGIGSNAVWFDFYELCEKPRSQLDYIALANKFKIILIDNIPQLDNGSKATIGMYDDRTKRFINLIDELYDRAILLIANFKNSLETLYLGYEYAFEFKRIKSRLIEMRSVSYFQKTNLPIRILP